MNILFVCTGNTFRSMSGEYLLKKALQDAGISNVQVRSAGTIAKPNTIYQETLDRLALYGCDASHHKQTKLTKELCKEQDLIICLSEHHRTTVHELGSDAVLFNEIAYNKTEDLMDDGEYGEKYGQDYDLSAYIKTIVDYIHEAMPFILEQIKKKLA